MTSAKQEPLWRDAKHFFFCDLGEITEQNKDSGGEGDEFQWVRFEMTRRIDGDEYEVLYNFNWGHEGAAEHVVWLKNGEYHRAGGKPATSDREERTYQLFDDDPGGEIRVQHYTEGVKMKEVFSRQAVRIDKNYGRFIDRTPDWANNGPKAEELSR